MRKNMNTKTTRQIGILLFLVTIFAAKPALPANILKWQNQKFIVCPETVNFQLQTPSGWDAGLSSRILLKFESSSTDGKNIYCEYDVNNSQYKNHVTITQIVPKGFRCQNDAAKSRKFTCEPNVPPIKIPKKNS